MRVRRTRLFILCAFVAGVGSDAGAQDAARRAVALSSQTPMAAEPVSSADRIWTPTSASRAKPYVLVGSIAGGLISAIIIGPPLHRAEFFPAPIAYGIAAAGGAAVGGIVGLVIWEVRRKRATDDGARTPARR